MQESTRAVLLGQLGALALVGGRLRDAERLLSDAITGLADDPVAEARVRMNRSVARLQVRDLDGAAVDLDVAARIFAESGLPVDGGQAEHNRAYVALLQGDLVAALRGMQEARPRAAASPITAGICDTDRAEVLRDAGLTRDAEQLLAATAKLFGAHRMTQLRAEAEFQLACSQLTHDPPHARRTAAAAARRFDLLGNRTWAARAEAVRMRAVLSGGAVRRGGGRLPDAGRIPSTDEVAGLATRLRRAGFPSEAASLRLGLAIWQARHGQRPPGSTIRVPASAPIQVQLLAHEARAVSARARGTMQRPAAMPHEAWTT
ncbi:hypothetical protein [Microbacterium elymi]|uniref:Tetratricopeptide repeat protein n=1 Tax=Microbacterium elymi TaxID=2909587 RepID=A0ABY5NLD1_9MICO|nr:hypothetical protein [Microbacterium elymi]UUT35991.1 hypothetical protein L2X98_23050 [Microbacterium elymi]